MVVRAHEDDEPLPLFRLPRQVYAGQRTWRRSIPLHRLHARMRHVHATCTQPILAVCHYMLIGLVLTCVLSCRAHCMQVVVHAPRA